MYQGKNETKSDKHKQEWMGYRIHVDGEKKLKKQLNKRGGA